MISTNRSFKDIFSSLIIREQQNTGNDIVKIADKIGISKSSLSAYMKGDRSPRSDVLLLIAKHFDVSCDYLLGISSIRTQEVSVHEMCKNLGLSEDSIETLRFLADNDEDIDVSENANCALSFLDEIIPWLELSQLPQDYGLLQQIREKGVDHQEVYRRASALENAPQGFWYVSMFGGTAARFLAYQIGSAISEKLLDTKSYEDQLEDAKAEVSWLEELTSPSEDE